MLTQDKWILQVVSGYLPRFRTQPHLQQAPLNLLPRMNQAEKQALVLEVKSLLDKGAIKAANLQTLGFYSQLFAVPKKDGGWRPIINLKSLNAYLMTPHFKMEGIQSLKDTLVTGDFMAKLDLKNAYLSVPMSKQTYRYLRFAWEGKVFEFSSLPFGLAPAPIVFTKLLKPAAAFLRRHGIWIHIYLDDMLLMAPSASQMQCHVVIASEVLTRLGFVLNLKKCETEPTQLIEFLGFTVNSESMTLSLPDSKVSKIRKECHYLLNQAEVSARQLAKLIGLLTSTLPAIEQAPLHYRALQRSKNQALAQGHH